MSMPWLLENWSTVASIGTLLSVGYMTARKFEKILGKHYFINKLSDFNYNEYFKLI
jgi:hypothetical protein